MARDAMPLPLTLPATLDTRAAESLRDRLLARRGEPLVLDGGEVARLGGLCLEVLLAARKTWAADGRPFGFGAASDALRDALTTFGAAELLESAA